MKHIIVVLTVCVFILSGCSEQKESKTIVNVKNDEELNVKYVSFNLELPYDKNSMNLAYIAEECIGILTNKDGQIEMYTVSRSVKEKYQKEAEDIIKQKGQLRPDMLECRIWKFTVDSERKWSREPVSKSPVIDEVEITKQNAKVVKFQPFYDSDGNLDLFLQYNMNTAEGNGTYKISAYQLGKKQWKTLGQYTYTEGKDEVQEPINTFIDMDDNLVIARMDGSIVKYNFSLNKVTAETSDYSEDLSLCAFSHKYGFCMDNRNSQINIFNTSDFVEEKQLSVPETTRSGSEVFGVDNEDGLYYVNSLGIYRENEDETAVEKIFSMDGISGVNVENMIFNYMSASNKGEMMIQMYDSMDENAQEYIYLIKKVEGDN